MEERHEISKVPTSGDRRPAGGKSVGGRCCHRGLADGGARGAVGRRRRTRDRRGDRRVRRPTGPPRDPRARWDGMAGRNGGRRAGSGGDRWSRAPYIGADRRTVPDRSAPLPRSSVGRGTHQAGGEGVAPSRARCRRGPDRHRPPPGAPTHEVERSGAGRPASGLRRLGRSPRSPACGRGRGATARRRGEVSVVTATEFLVLSAVGLAVSGLLVAWLAGLLGRERFGWWVVGTALGPLSLAPLLSSVRAVRRAPLEPWVFGSDAAEGSPRVLAVAPTPAGLAAVVSALSRRLGWMTPRVTPALSVAVEYRLRKPSASAALEREVDGALRSADVRIMHAGLMAERKVLFGEPVPAVLAELGRVDYACVVIARKGWRVRRLPEKIALLSPCPVLVTDVTPAGRHPVIGLDPAGGRTQASDAGRAAAGRRGEADGAQHSHLGARSHEGRHPDPEEGSTAKRR